MQKPGSLATLHTDQGDLTLLRTKRGLAIHDSQGRKAGVLLMEARPDKNYARIWLLKVEDDFRKRGLATELVNQAKAMTAQLGLGWLLVSATAFHGGKDSLSQQQLEDFYIHRGFEKLPKRQNWFYWSAAAEASQ